MSSLPIPPEFATEYARCAADPWYFIATYVFISDPNRGNVKFEAWPHLQRLLYLTLTNDRIIILKARQIGVTWFYVCLALWYALFRPNSNVLVISRRQIESTEFKKRCRYVYDRLPEWLHIRDEKRDKDNDELFEFGVMSSAIHSLPATEDSGRSSTATIVILDEWAFQQYARSIFTAILPTVEHGKLIGISTANGKNNLFYEVYDKAKRKINTFLPIFIPYTVRPGRNDAWWAATAANMDSTEEAMREYPKAEAEAFTVMANCIFNLPALDAMPIAPGNPFGKYSEIWHSYHPETRYVAGIDPAPGGGDNSVCQVLDDQGRQVARVSTNEDIDLFAAEAHKLLAAYRFPQVIVERQGEGNSIIRHFKAWEYPHHRIWKPSAEGDTWGWHTTQSNRDEILADLRAAVRERRLTIYSSDTLAEFRGFGKNEQGKYEGIFGHDDEVMSMALTWHLLDTLPPPSNPADWQPQSYLNTGRENPLRDVNWRKRHPTQCYYMIREDGKPRRRCGIIHKNIQDMLLCPHQ